MVLIKRVLLAIYGLPIFLFIISAPSFCGRRRGFRGWYWRLVKRACGWLLWSLSIRVEISEAGRAALAADAGSLIAVNHRSYLDGFALMTALPQEKWVTFGAKKELCDNVLIRSGFRSAGIASIDRRDGRQALDSLCDAVRAMPWRRSLILFLEGTRASGPGLGPFKAGAVLIAKTTERKIRPVCISNADVLLPRGAKTPSAGVIRVDVLPHFTPDASATVDDDVERLRRVMSAVYDQRCGRDAPK